MSLTSEFPANNVLPLFKSDLQEQYSELTRTIDRAHKEIRALADSRPGDVIGESCGNCSKEAIFATYSQSRTQLREVAAALERLATGEFWHLCCLWRRDWPQTATSTALGKQLYRVPGAIGAGPSPVIDPHASR